MFRWGWGRPKEKKLWRPASRGCKQYNSSIWYGGCLYWKRLLYSALNRRVGLLLTQFRTKLSMLIFWHIKYMVYQIAKEGIHVISCTIWILLKHKILKVEEYNFWACYLKYIDILSNFPYFPSIDDMSPHFWQVMRDESAFMGIHMKMKEEALRSILCYFQFFLWFEMWHSVYLKPEN